MGRGEPPGVEPHAYEARLLWVFTRTKGAVGYRIDRMIKRLKIEIPAAAAQGS